MIICSNRVCFDVMTVWLWYCVASSVILRTRRNLIGYSPVWWNMLQIFKPFNFSYSCIQQVVIYGISDFSTQELLNHKHIYSLICIFFHQLKFFLAFSKTLVFGAVNSSKAILTKRFFTKILNKYVKKWWTIGDRSEYGEWGKTLSHLVL